MRWAAAEARMGPTRRAAANAAAARTSAPWPPRPARPHPRGRAACGSCWPPSARARRAAARRTTWRRPRTSTPAPRRAARRAAAAAAALGGVGLDRSPACGFSDARRSQCALQARICAQLARAGARSWCAARGKELRPPRLHPTILRTVRDWCAAAAGAAGVQGQRSCGRHWMESLVTQGAHVLRLNSGQTPVKPRARHPGLTSLTTTAAARWSTTS
jgi:hypothetical protein